MNRWQFKRIPWSIVLGDGVIYLLVTITGFSSHDTLAWRSLPRMLTTFLPFTASWFIIAPWLGVFRQGIICSRSHLLRVLLAVIYSATMGAFLRGLWLGTPILPVFVLVMAAVSAGFLIVWRSVLQIIMCRSG
jgi:hypothetical protein